MLRAVYLSLLLSAILLTTHVIIQTSNERRPLVPLILLNTTYPCVLSDRRKLLKGIEDVRVALLVHGPLYLAFQCRFLFCLRLSLPRSGASPRVMHGGYIFNSAYQYTQSFVSRNEYLQRYSSTSPFSDSQYMYLCHSGREKCSTMLRWQDPVIHVLVRYFAD